MKSVPSGMLLAWPSPSWRHSGRWLVLGNELVHGEGRALRVAKDGQPHERAVSRRDHDLTAKTSGLFGHCVGVVGGEGDGPLSGGGRVAGGNGGDGGYHVFEAGDAELRGHGANTRCQLLEVVAITRQCPETAGGDAERGPSEHGAVEGLRPVHVARGQAVEVQRTVLVDYARPA